MAKKVVYKVLASKGVASGQVFSIKERRRQNQRVHEFSKRYF